MSLSSNQQKFKHWLSVNAPELMYLWDWDDKSVNTDAVQSYLSTASHGQSIMCRFSVAVWFNKNRFDFDLMDAASILDAEKRMAIAAWLVDPFWP